MEEHFTYNKMIKTTFMYYDDEKTKGYSFQSFGDDSLLGFDFRCIICNKINVIDRTLDIPLNDHNCPSCEAMYWYDIDEEEIVIYHELFETVGNDDMEFTTLVATRIIYEW